MKKAQKLPQKQENRIDHDRIFKELLQVFLVDFLSLFCSDILAYLDTNSLVFLNKEVFTDVVSGEKHEVDLVAQGKILGKPNYFIVHIENESSKKKVNKQPFGRRMFHYFSRLLDTYNVPIYPIVVFSYDAPKLVEPNSYKVGLPDFEVLSFSYRVVQLNVLGRDARPRSNVIESPGLVSNPVLTAPKSIGLSQWMGMRKACAGNGQALRMSHTFKRRMSRIVDRARRLLSNLKFPIINYIPTVINEVWRLTGLSNHNSVSQLVCSIASRQLWDL